MPPNTLDERERLAMLAKALDAKGLTADAKWYSAQEYVRVINPDAPNRRMRVVVQNNYSDSYALWFYASWQDPIAPARDIAAAVARIIEILTPRPGASDAEV